MIHAVPSEKIPNQQPNFKCPKSGLSGLLAGIMNEKRGATPHTTEDDVTVSAAEPQVRLVYSILYVYIKLITTLCS